MATPDPASQASEEAPPTPAAPELKGFLPEPAVRTVADVKTDQLIASTASPQILGGPRKGGRAGGEGEDHGDGLHLLAGLAVDVDLAGLGLGEGLAARGPCAHPVELLRVHGREDY